jgi:hypothetical protein
MTFGDLKDEASAVSRAARSPRSRQLLEELGTHPAIYYLNERERRA